MSHVCVSVIVTEQSQILESTLLRSDIPLDREEAIAHRAELEQWLEMLPIPGQQRRELPVDGATELAIKLPQILGSRDPALFGQYYLDPEGDASFIERRPYDWTRLEVA